MNNDFKIQQFYKHQRLQQVILSNGDSTVKIVYNYPKDEYVETEITDTKIANELLKKYML